MLKSFDTVIDGVKVRTKTLPATKAIVFTEVLDEILPKLAQILNLTGKIQDTLLDKDVPTTIEEVTEALKEKFSTDDVSTLIAKACEVLKWRQNGNLIRFMAGEEPYSDCRGGILESTEIEDAGTYRAINFDEDFAGQIELAFKMMFWVVRQNYPYFFGLMGK
jgi:hypothetical protein